jgi:high-affinity iron transporter
VLANYLIGLREGLEASLVVVILIAYLVKSERQNLLPRIWAGIILAISVSLGFGALLTWGPKRLTFEAQEALGGSLSIIAVGFVTWMVFWMASHARGLSGELRGKVDGAAEAGGISLVVMAALAVGREGLETALFIWAATQAATGVDSSKSSTTPLIGALLGILTAVAMGYAFYKGVLSINLSKFFRWTGIILIVVAAGVLAYGFHDLQEANIVGGLNDLAFDVTSTIDPNSWFGTLLKGVFNFQPDPTWFQVGVWLGYLVPVMTIFLIRTRTKPGAPAPVPVASTPATS